MVAVIFPVDAEAVTASRPVPNDEMIEVAATRTAAARPKLRAIPELTQS